MLFSIYLEHCLNDNPVVLEAISNWKIFAFADDLLLIYDNQEEATKLIQAISSLNKFGLDLTKSKSAILSDHSDHKNVKLIEGISIKKQIKYLGCQITLTRGSLL